MQTLHVHQMMELYGTLLPLAILLVNVEETVFSHFHAEELSQVLDGNLSLSLFAQQANEYMYMISEEQSS